MRVMSKSTVVAVVHRSQRGVNRKQSRLVERVTNRETASFPPPLRVITEAAAVVQGTVAAIIKPNRRSGDC